MWYPCFKFWKFNILKVTYGFLLQKHWRKLNNTVSQKYEDIFHIDEIKLKWVLLSIRHHVLSLFPWSVSRPTFVIHEVYLWHVGLYPTFVFIQFISGRLLHVLPLHSWSSSRARWLITNLCIHKVHLGHVTSCPTIASMK